MVDQKSFYCCQSCHYSLLSQLIVLFKPDFIAQAGLHYLVLIQVQLELKVLYPILNVTQSLNITPLLISSTSLASASVPTAIIVQVYK